MKASSLAKEIRGSLRNQNAYLNTREQGRKRIFDVRSTRDGHVMVKVLSPGSRTKWWEVQPNESVSIFAGTVMEEVLTTSI